MFKDLRKKVENNEIDNLLDFDRVTEIWTNLYLFDRFKGHLRAMRTDILNQLLEKFTETELEEEVQIWSNPKLK